MKHLKKFNENNEHIENISHELKELFKQEVSIEVPLEYLLKDCNFLILTNNGKIYEFRSGSLDAIWDSDEEFKKQTGASINVEYAGNKSVKFLRFLKSINYDYSPESDFFADYKEIIDEIDSIYFEGSPSELLKRVIK